MKAISVASRALLGLVLALQAGCQPPQATPILDGRVRITFEGRDYAGYEAALANLSSNFYRPVGTADAVDGPIADRKVLQLGDLDPTKFVVMAAVSGLPYAHVLFVEERTLAASESRPFGEAFPELCPFLSNPVFRTGCPGVASPTPERAYSGETR